jgi:hypothetical protein
MGGINGQMLLSLLPRWSWRVVLFPSAKKRFGAA